MSEIRVGDKVRSFDFEGRELTGERACYVEGTVVEIGKPPAGVCNCDNHYHIVVEKRVWGGKANPTDGFIGQTVYPPTNGSPSLFNENGTDGVVLIERPDYAAEEAAYEDMRTDALERFLNARG